MAETAPKIINIMLDEAVSTTKNRNLEKTFTGITLKEQGEFLEKVGQKLLAANDIQQAKDKILNAILSEIPYFMPRARQVRDDKGYWNTHSEKVFLPLRGQQKQEKFALFGLDEQAIQIHWIEIQQKVNNKEIDYRAISKHNNCSGIAAGILAAGGAGDFVPFKSSIIVETPNDVHHYALAVQNKIDRLNQQSKEIQAFYEREKSNPSLNVISGRPVSGASMTALRNNIHHAINAMPSVEKQRLSALEKAVRDIEGADQKALTKASIAFVEALSDLLNNPLPSPQTAAVAHTLFRAAAMRELLEKKIKDSITTRIN